MEQLAEEFAILLRSATDDDIFDSKIPNDCRYSGIKSCKGNDSPSVSCGSSDRVKSKETFYMVRESDLKNNFNLFVRAYSIYLG